MKDTLTPEKLNNFFKTITNNKNKPTQIGSYSKKAIKKYEKIQTVKKFADSKSRRHFQVLRSSG